jgi:hypothetical protein
MARRPVHHDADRAKPIPTGRVDGIENVGSHFARVPTDGLGIEERLTNITYQQNLIGRSID